MKAERNGDFISSLSLDRMAGRELRFAAFADAEEVRGHFHNAELPLCHELSLPL